MCSSVLRFITHAQCLGKVNICGIWHGIFAFRCTQAVFLPLSCSSATGAFEVKSNLPPHGDRRLSGRFVHSALSKEVRQSRASIVERASTKSDCDGGCFDDGLVVIGIDSRPLSLDGPLEGFEVGGEDIEG